MRSASRLPPLAASKAPDCRPLFRSIRCRKEKTTGRAPLNRLEVYEGSISSEDDDDVTKHEFESSFKANLMQVSADR